MKSSPRTTIIGAGIVGVSAAAFLQRLGHRVTIIDRLPPGEGCSFGNAGGVAFAEVVPTVHPRILLKIPGWLLDPTGPLTIRWSYLPRALPWFLAAGRNALPDRMKRITAARADLGLRVVADFETLLDQAGTRELLRYEDTLRLYDTEVQYAAEEGERRLKREHGYETRRLSPAEVAEIEPAVARDIACGAFHGGWYFVRNPQRVVTSIASCVARNGGEIITDEVVRVEATDGRARDIVLGSGRRMPVERLVICAGAYSGLLARALGERVLLEAERGYHMTIPDPGVELGRSLTWAGRHGAITPMEMGLRIAGTDEFAGLEAAPNWRRSDILYAMAKRCLPGLRAPDGRETRWMGRRPGTPDSLPVISRASRLENVYYGFGHGHMGLTWGPTTGRLLSELMSGSRSNIDLTPFRVDRF
jgi:D-amino-acid dehydrogenase